MKPAVVCTPLLVERIALGRLPGLTVVRTGMGPRRSAAAASRLAADGPRPVIVAGVAGSLSTDVRPGDVVVTPSATPLADALREFGLRVHAGPIVSVDRPADGAARRALAGTGALAVDMESEWLAAAAAGGPFAAVRTIVDTPDHPLWRVGTGYRGVKALRALRRTAPAITRWATDKRFTTSREVT